MTIFFSPAHQADLVVGHGEGDCLLVDPSGVAVKLGCDINATGDGPSSMYLRFELVHLGDLHDQGLQASTQERLAPSKKSEKCVRCVLKQTHMWPFPLASIT